MADFGNHFNDLGTLSNTNRTPAPSAENGGIRLSTEQATALMAPLNENGAICAGAGAGKTRLLVERAARLVSFGVNPDKVVIVTFTRKSAQEIRERIAQRLGKKASAKDKLPRCTTVHALALAILRKKHPSLVLATEEQCLGICSELLEALDEDEEHGDLDPEELLMVINKAREDVNYYSSAGVLAARYEARLREEGLKDFTVLLTEAIDELHGLFDFILVDEAQDLSQLQQIFIRAIGTSAAKYWYIGDGDQSIYTFRGAHSGVMRELAEAAEAKYELRTNYRSSTSVVEHANRLIGLNLGRIDIQWLPHRTDEGSVDVKEFRTDEDELAAVIKWLEAAPKGKRMVLSRTQSLIAALKEKEYFACSVHESKGLEWDEVWVIGCEAGLFPHPLCTTSEERRLFYVAMTRARDNLILSFAGSRVKLRKGKPVRYRRKPSRFIDEALGL